MDGVEGHCSVVVWNVPKEPNGRIRNYALIFIPNAGNDRGLEIETENDQTSFVIRPELGLQRLLDMGSVFVKVCGGICAIILCSCKLRSKLYVHGSD